MTVVETASRLSEQLLGQLAQYTMEAYKTFEKLAENLPNPMTAQMFKNFAVEERANRDLIDMKVAATTGSARVKVTLGGDLLFQEILEGDLSYREMTEFLISRERTMQRKLEELAQDAPSTDRNLLVYISTSKRSHIVELQRELELIKGDADWFKREDAEYRMVHGHGPDRK